MKKDKNKHIETVDALDKELIEMFSHVKTTANARNAATSDEFTRRVMGMLPRRDISLWVVGIATLMGVFTMCMCMGVEGFINFMEEMGGFFTSLCSSSMPTMESVMCVVGVAVVMYIVCESILSTEDYMLEE